MTPVSRDVGASRRQRGRSRVITRRGGPLSVPITRWNTLMCKCGLSAISLGSMACKSMLQLMLNLLCSQTLFQFLLDVVGHRLAEFRIYYEFSLPFFFHICFIYPAYCR